MGFGEEDSITFVVLEGEDGDGVSSRSRPSKAAEAGIHGLERGTIWKAGVGEI